MPEFTYIARDLHGKKTNGTIAAATQREAISLLTGRSLFPIRVDAAPSKGGWHLSRRISGQQMAVLYSQLSSLLRSGVPLLRALRILQNQTSDDRLQQILEDVHSRVEEGTSLADAMRQHPNAFSELAVSMIRAGAEGGFLDEALRRVADFTEQQEDLKSRTLGALAYPVFVATLGSMVVFVLIVFFVPNFAEIFDQLRQQGQLPALTEWLLWFSSTLRQWGLVFVIAAVFAALYVRRYVKTETGRRRADALRIRLPLLGGIYLSLAVARFCRVLGTLLHNGVPILKSLEISRDASGNRILSDAIRQAGDNISAGDSLATPLAASGYFPSTVVEMIAVAEESNTLDEVLTDVADQLERRTSRRLDLVVRLLEPIMLLLLAGVVLIVVIALLTPIFRMTSTV